MPVSLNTFVNHANSIEGNRSIYLDKHDAVKDHGKVGTFFTRASTFRNTTNQFIHALTEEYGNHVGELAQDMLRSDLDAGRPLTASMVKEFVALGKQHKMQGMLKDISSNKASMCAFVNQLTGKDLQELPDQQFTQLSQCVRQHAASLIEHADTREELTMENLVSGMVKNHELPLLQRSVDLITDNQNSSLVHLCYPRERDPQMVQDKLQVLNMFQGQGDDEVLNSTLIRAMTALSVVRENIPAPGEFTCADVFHAIFPEGTLPTMEPPDDETMALCTPKQFTDLVEAGLKDFQDNFTADMLPADSPFRGNASHTETALREAKGKLFMPATIANLHGTRVTLADLPQIQFDVTADSHYTDYNAALNGLNKDMCRRGWMGMTETGVQPTITFPNHLGGDKHVITIGTRKYADIPKWKLTEDQKNYIDGKHSSVSDEIVLRLNDTCQSPEQKKAVLGCLNQSGCYPMWHAMRAFGDFAAFREHCAYNQEVIKNDDGSVDVTLTTSPDLKSINGTASMVYHVDVDGRVGISDFQWDKPTLEERKEGVKNNTGYTQSIASRINSCIKEMQMTEAGGKQFAAAAHALLDGMVDAATCDEDFPTFDQLRALLPPGETADPNLTVLANVMKSRPLMNMYMNMEPEQGKVFAKVATLVHSTGNDIALGLLYEHLDEFMTMENEGTLSEDTIWNTLFNEPVPESARRDWSKVTSLSHSAIANRWFDEIMDIAEQELKAKLGDDIPRNVLSPELSARQGVAGGALSCGLRRNQAMELVHGNRLNHLGLEDIRLGGAMIYCDHPEDLDKAEISLFKDLRRMNANLVDGKVAHDIEAARAKHQTDETVEIPEIPKPGASQVSVMLPSSKAGASESLVFDPMKPDLTGEELEAYKTAETSELSGDIRDRITAFCGKENKVQIVNVMLAMSQAGQGFLRDLVGSLDVLGSEHAPNNISVFGDDQKNVHVRYENVENSPLKYHWEVLLTPDGKQKYIDFDMERVNAFVPRN